jgi:molecular chaperone DnaJ
MSDKRDYYDVLGVPREANAQQIKKAFRKLARQYHPDVSQEADAAERFKEANEAHEVLSDPQKRAAYDRFGHAGMSGAGGFGGSGFNADFAGGINEIFEEFFGGGGFGSSRRQQRGPRRGADLRYDLTITFEEAVLGVEKEIEFRRPETCDHCHGGGAEPGTTPTRCTTCKGSGEVRRMRQSILGSFVNVTTCPECRGSGELITSPCKECRGQKTVQKKVKKTIKVPAGVDNDNQLRVNGEGAPGVDNGPSGNLFIVFHVKDHDMFERRGNDIMLDLEINVAQAALGDDITVPTIDGKEKLTIPAGTQSGTVFRLRNKGVPYLQHEGRGDQLVITQVAIPKRLTEKQEKLFHELSQTLGKEVIPQKERGFLHNIKDALGDVFGV